MKHTISGFLETCFVYISILFTFVLFRVYRYTIRYGLCEQLLLSYCSSTKSTTQLVLEGMFYTYQLHETMCNTKVTDRITLLKFMFCTKCKFKKLLGFTQVLIQTLKIPTYIVIQLCVNYLSLV